MRAIQFHGHRCDIHHMHRHQLDVLDGYDVTGQPVVTATRLAYVPWVQQALLPYNATRLPQGPAKGLWDALQRARHAAAISPGVAEVA